MDNKDMKQLFGTLSPDEDQLNRMKANINERTATRRRTRLHAIPIITAALILVLSITAVSASPALMQWFFPGVGVVEVDHDTTEPLYMMLDNTSSGNDCYTATYGFWLDGTVQFWIESAVRYDEMDVHELLPYSDAELSLISVTRTTASGTMTGCYSIRIPNITSEQAAKGVLFAGGTVKFNGMPSQYRQYTAEQCGMRLTLIPLTEDFTTFAIELEYTDGRGSVTPVSKKDVGYPASFTIVDRNEKVYALTNLPKTNIFTTREAPSAEIVRFASDCIAFSSFFPETPVIVTIELPEPGEAVTLNREFTFPDGVTKGMITAVGYNNPIEECYDREHEKNFPQGYLAFITAACEQNGIKYGYNINYSADYFAFIEPHLVVESKTPYDQSAEFNPMAPRIMIRDIGDGEHTSFHYVDDGSGTFDAMINYYSAQAFGDWEIIFE